MQRKIVKHGPATLTVSLPAKWVKKHHLQQGDELSIREEEAQLIISKNIQNKERKIIIEIPKNFHRYIRSYLGRLYRQGYTTIVVSYSHPDCIPQIKHAVHNLIGAELLDIEQHRATIQILPIQGTEIDNEEYIRKMLITVKTMVSIIAEDIHKKTFVNEETLEELRNNNWKIKDFLLRRAALLSCDYEEYSTLAHITFCYEKIGTKLNNYYKRYLKTTPIKRKAQFNDVITALDWLIAKTAQKQITLDEEAEFRNRLLQYALQLVKKSGEEKNDMIPILYFTVDLLDATVSYLGEYKKIHQKIC